MKTVLKVGSIITAIMVIAGCDSGNSQGSGLKIGAILPLTGNIAYFGDPERKAIELYKDMYPESGMEIIYEDSCNDARKSVVAYNKLRNINNIRAVISQMTGVNMALAPLSERNKTFQFSLAMDPDVAKQSRYVIRCYEDVADESYAVWEDLTKRFAGRDYTIAVAYLDDPWGLYAKDSFANVARNDMVSYVSFNFSTSPKDIVLKLMAKGRPDVIFIIGYGPIVANLLRSVKEFGGAERMIIYGNIGMSWDYIIKMAGRAIEGCYVAMPAFDQYDLSVEFTKRYYEKYGEYPNFEAAYTFDTMNLMMSFLKTGKASFDIKTFSGVCGDYKFDEEGNSHMTKVAIRRVENGKLVTESYYWH